MKAVSLRRTALAWMTALLGLVGLIAMLAAYTLARSEAADFLDGQLRQVALNAGRGLADADAPPAADQDPEDQIAVTTWKRGVLVRSDLPGTSPTRPTATGYADAVISGEAWRTYTTDNDVWTIQVAQRDRVRREIARSAAIGAATPVLLVIPFAWLVLGLAMNRILARLDGLARDLSERSATAAAPLPIDGIPVEIAPLVAGMNGLIVRLRAMIEAQQRFVADAAHALRTPLAAMQVQVDNLADGIEADLPAHRCALAAGVKRASSLVDQLLRLARLEVPAPVFGPVEIEPLLLDCVGEHVVLAESWGVDLGFKADAPASVQGVAEEIRVLVAILIDNAIRYTPAGGQVDVVLHRADGVAVIDVVDTGRGIPVGTETQIFDRFFRAAPESGDGSGLGLAIARRIAERNELELTVENRQDGDSGVRARIVLPA
ncbi:two-component sensor histidine kinase [Methylobacterium sp. C25]|uniref:ATP-binding protein n=1 Tax=Methylobacterium sp. C25 TaxID=2721622 RepID=UPI001F32F605|nr:ATP-binding protein [Methylobacterium sp. C25]MCE4224944.1 two-component sensor histidine kinase [Methylobacterium sp. C25]